MTPLQFRICYLRVHNLTYKEIRDCLESEGVHISCDDVLVRCFLRTALGFRWEPGYQGGRDPYLCEEDADELVKAISDASTALDCCPTHFVINFAHQLKIDRLNKAFTFLQFLHCDRLAQNLELDVEPPTRAWLVSFVAEHGLRIRSPQRIEAVRRKACDRIRIAEWFSRYGQLLARYDPDMVLNMDETGLATNNKFKVAVPDGCHPIVPGGKQKDVHLTGVVTISATGRVFTPVVILPALQKLPDELHEFDGRAHFFRSKSGWMTRELFELYCVNLAHELTHLRQILPREKRGKRFLLILDGHSSRKSPKAIAYLQQHGIDVLTLPGHSTHVLQPFDVGMAGVLKMTMAKTIEMWNRILAQGRVVAPTAAGTKRYVLVSSFLTAVDHVYRDLVQSAFAKSGIVPLQADIPLSSPLILPDSAFDHRDDWINSCYFGPGSREMFIMFSDAGIQGLVTTEEILEGKRDQALTTLHPRIDYVCLVDFAVPV